MNSLTELNNFVSDLTFEYTDTRLPNVILSSATAVDQTQNVDEGFSFDSSVGIDIVEVVNAALSVPTYTINVYNLSGATVSWESLPSGVTLTNPSTGTYVLSGIDDVSIWELVKYATINMPSNYNGIWSYTSSISFYSNTAGNVTKTWTTTVNVSDVVFFTTPQDFTYALDESNLIANTPQIINVDTLYPGVTWTVVATPNSITSVDTWTTTGTGGTFSVNGTTKVITIVGTRAQVNSRLAGLTIDSNGNAVDFSLSYTITNSLTAETDRCIQILNSYGLLYLTNTTPMYFIEDATVTTVTGYPTITDTIHDGSGTYTLTITPNTVSAISYIDTTATQGNDSFNNSTKVLTITGTRSQVNQRLASIIMQTATDWATDFNLTYSLTTPLGVTTSKIQSLNCGSNDTEVTNMNVNRTYYSNRANSIFSATTPSITDFDETNPNYTIIFTSSLGKFAFDSDTPVTTLSFTGTKSQCNAKFSTVKFYPTAAVYANGTLTYTQQKNGVTQLAQSVTLLGTYAAYNNTRSFLLTTSQIYTPSYEDVTYGNWEVALVGGGAAGFSGPITTSGISVASSGGGGGGEVVQYTNIAVSQQAYNINIGAGGDFRDVYTTSVWDGGDTTGFGYTARGGKGGSYINAAVASTARDNDYSKTGGNSGNGNLGGVGRYYYPDGTYTAIEHIIEGGGGAGAGEGYTYGVADFTISGTRSTYTGGTYTGLTPTGGSGTGLVVTVVIDAGGSNSYVNITNITITNAGSGYADGDVLKIAGNLIGHSTPANDLTLTVVGSASADARGKKGVYIAWTNSANSMYGWYGGGGSGETNQTSTPYDSGSIGNLVTFAANGYTQTSGLTKSRGTGPVSNSGSGTPAPANSGGGGGARADGGSGVIGIRITSK